MLQKKKCMPNIIYKKYELIACSNYSLIIFCGYHRPIHILITTIAIADENCGA